MTAASRKKGLAAKQGPKLIDLADSTLSRSASQARSCLIETPLAVYVRRRTAAK